MMFAIRTIMALLLIRTSALQSIFPRLETRRGRDKSSKEMENALVSAIEEGGARLAKSENIDRLVTQLENSGESIPEPAVSEMIYGKWRLLYTSNTDTSSPIQRKAVNSQAFQIFQDIVIDTDQLLIRQIVQFSNRTQLCVDALASTPAYPLPELTERKSSGKILGLNVLGVSQVGDDAKEDPSRPNSRISFVFDKGEFDFDGFKLPYPVPFRLPLFRDAVKGWIDITYLSDRLRISRGNKGTTFVLRKES